MIEPHPTNDARPQTDDAQPPPPVHLAEEHGRKRSRSRRRWPPRRTRTTSRSSSSRRGSRCRPDPSYVRPREASIADAIATSLPVGTSPQIPNGPLESLGSAGQAMMLKPPLSEGSVTIAGVPV